ncbi:Phosphatidylinositol-3,5-bisphosphate 3-phosphatase [Aphelenchoides bicaudatus]|nr:Phosphatidylinositol-3,5-bisphosphate 3-phosphatase [Aphelenchoides bicaudatus]
MNRLSYATAVDPHDSPFQAGPKYVKKHVSVNWLLPGEEIKFKEPFIGYQSDEGRIECSLWLTNYRLRFQKLEDSYNQNSQKSSGSVWDVSLGTISNVKKMGYSKVSRKEDSYGIQIKCKDLRKIILFCKPENHSRRDLYENLRLYAFPNTNKLTGWNIYNAQAEFRRMGIPNDFWDFSDINNSYEFAPTYPSCLVLPRGSINRGDNFIQSVGDFRSKKRIPVLSWYCKQNGASITRSSQPMVGLASKRSSNDETHIQMIIEANPNNRKLLILDARPTVNAKVNKAVGGGYEDGYGNCELEFLDIQNIHVVRDSLKGLKSACYPRIDFKTFNKTLEDTRWLSHIQSILNGAKRAVTEILTNQQSILVHCSDGWDRTAQLTSLTQLQIDPYYRTLEGFIVLIEKEWCGFGHKFAHRIGHGEDKHKDEERSPIFVQFIDCVWQLFNQFTTAFEFNVQLLKTILDELYTCRFGTFLYNSEKERNDLEVKTNTVSLWSYIFESRSQFINESYNQKQTSSIDYFLSAPNKANHAKLWSDYYCQHNNQVCVKENETIDSPTQDKQLNTINGTLQFTSL